MASKSIDKFFKRRAPADDNDDASDGPSKKQKADDGLSDEERAKIETNRQKALAKGKLKLEFETMGASWRDVLLPEMEKPYFKELKAFWDKEKASKTIYPTDADVYSWTRSCAFSDVRVVILGQDPYIKENQAHGMAFSVQRGVKTPPSLANMYKELATCIPGFKIPSHGYLDGWAREGVLLLNAVLTVEHGKSNSHKGHGWETFTDATIALLSKKLKGVVFLLWGTPAKKKKKLIDTTKHHVLECVHPSPLSAHSGWFGNACFKKANDILKAEGKKEINWCSICE